MESWSFTIKTKILCVGLLVFNIVMRKCLTAPNYPRYGLPNGAAVESYRSLQIRRQSTRLLFRQVRQQNALWRGQPLYLFDPSAAEKKHGIWATIKLIQEWFNREPSDMDYAGFSFADAERKVADFFPKPKAELLKCDRPPE